MSKASRSRARKRLAKQTIAIALTLLIVPGESLVLAQSTQTAAAAPDTTGAKESVQLSPDQLDALVAPIALYPDPLLAQTLVAATYPLELVQLQQWMAKHPDLKDQALADSVAAQPWDPSIQSMAALPDVVKRLADDIQWTTDLGNAFLAQQTEVMDAVQRMRKKAKDNGALESNEQQKVETKVVEQKTVIVVEPSDPEVIYVPSYSPTVVYGPPIYPYPPIYYPYYPPGAAFVSFGFGMMWGAAMWGGSCCGCGWGGGNININVNNNFNRVSHHNTNIGGGNRGGGAGGGNWKHNPQHRGGAPYGDRKTASQFGGTARGDSRPGSAGVSDRMAGGAGNRGGAGVSDRATGGAGNRGGTGVSDRATGGAGNRAGSPGVSDRSAGAGNRAGSAGSRGGDNIGSRNIPQSSGSKSSFNSGSRGYSGSSARSSSSRGSSSYGGSRGGGSRGGGGRGGGGRR